MNSGPRSALLFDVAKLQVKYTRVEGKRLLLGGGTDCSTSARLLFIYSPSISSKSFQLDQFLTLPCYELKMSFLIDMLKEANK